VFLSFVAPAFRAPTRLTLQVWDSRTYTLETLLRGHTGSVLALEYASDKHWLFSSSGVLRVCSVIPTSIHRNCLQRGQLRPRPFHFFGFSGPLPAHSHFQVWDTKELSPLYVINPFLDTDSGDIFSLAWSPTLSTIYIGCQNTSLQWYNFRDSLNTPSQQSSGTSTPRRAHKFFNSYPRSQRRSPDLESSNGLNKALRGVDGHVLFINPPIPRAEFSIPAQNVINSAHYGYVYCMVLVPSTRQGATSATQKDVLLATGSGDETVKVRMVRMHL